MPAEEARKLDVQGVRMGSSAHGMMWAALFLLLFALLQAVVIVVYVVLTWGHLSAYDLVRVAIAVPHVVLFVWLARCVAHREQLGPAAAISGLFAMSIIACATIGIAEGFPMFVVWLFVAYGALLTPAFILLAIACWKRRTRGAGT